MSSHDRVVVVTGGASGIGLGVSRLFARNGHPVAMLDIQQDALDRESAALRSEGAAILARKVDVSDRNSIEAAYAAVREELGPIAIVVANAGISEGIRFQDVTVETWQRMIDINLTGVFHTVQAALPDMVAAGWGRIITISSQAAQSGAADRAHYSAAKAGVIGLTRALAREFAGQGITVNTIPPSVVATPMAEAGIAAGTFPPLDVIAQHIPIPRPGTPEDIAAACEYLASDGAGYVTGQVLAVNGGMFIG
ncbi:SDR family NAD(P)-dependent oxidoreductase [Novosphingobium sp. ST904]|uniref:SDR family NAD(P)-dependent oxidoreductase n=1 Tax=Novosphingobium sp. ST904 TaxID=1684385 RepID=UPI0006C87595|nr:SDR family NAD(P)-dependent oxidoreductase [Novosphingobium sp. ST904]KPH58076.1 short-chain dehydrogenase [Novosphingobium sp. ST904]TCM41497.1 NAD(P)-dependent dehydrogenase (short-subunit alcohol dehydrogenase family) [Novosphingobium sp. ST904]